MSADEHISRHAQDVVVRIASCVKRVQETKAFVWALDTNPRKLMLMHVEDAFHQIVSSRARNRVEEDFGSDVSVSINGSNSSPALIKEMFENAVKDGKHLVIITHLHLLAPVDATGPMVKIVDAKIREVLSCANRLVDLDCDVTFIGLFDESRGLNKAIGKSPLARKDCGQKALK